MSKLQELIQKLCPDGVEYKKLGEVCTINRGVRVVRSQLTQESKYPVYQNSLIPLGNYDYFNCEANTTFIIAAGEAGKIGFCKSPFWAADDCFYFKSQKLEQRYIYHVLLSNQDYFIQKVRKASVPRISRSVIEKFEIPVPPLEVQEEIVRILDHFTNLAAELQAGKEQYEYYRNKPLSFNNMNGECAGVTWMKMSEILVSIRTGLNPRCFFKLNTPDARNYYVTIREIKGGRLCFSEKTDRINNEALKLCDNRSNLEIGDVLFSGTGTIGETFVITENPTNWNIKEGVYSLKPKKEIINPSYLRYILMAKHIRDSYMSKVEGGTVKSISMKLLGDLKIPIPPLPVQEEIVRILDHFTELAAELQAELQARKEQYEYYRNKLLSFNDINGGVRKA